MSKNDMALVTMQKLLHTELNRMLAYFREFEAEPSLCVQNGGYVSKRVAFAFTNMMFEKNYPGRQPSPYETSSFSASVMLAWATYVWEKTKGVYRFDPVFLAELEKSEFTYPIPSDVLRHLPEPCTVIRLPDGFYKEGFRYVFVIQDETPYGKQLVLMFQDGEPEDPKDWDTSYMTIPLNQKWVEEKDVGMLNSPIENPGGDPNPDVSGVRLPGRTEPVKNGKELVLYHHKLARKILPLLIYLGSYQPDIERVTTDHAIKNDPGRPIKHEVGAQTAILMQKVKKEYEQTEGQEIGKGQKKTPHYRRPHFRMQILGPRPKTGEPDKRYHRVTWVSGSFIHKGEGEALIRNRIIT